VIQSHEMQCMRGSSAEPETETEQVRSQRGVFGIGDDDCRKDEMAGGPWGEAEVTCLVYIDAIQHGSPAPFPESLHNMRRMDRDRL